MTRFYPTITAVSGFLVVALGAFGAHILAPQFSPRMMDIWEKAVNYQMFQTAALGFTVVLTLQSSSRWLLYSLRLFSTGTLLFSGSLYLMAITGVNKLGMVTPFGGTALLLGWIMLAIHSLRFFKDR